MEKILNFDMDGTFVDLYGVENWLDDLTNSRTRPYEIAKPLGIGRPDGLIRMLTE